MRRLFGILLVMLLLTGCAAGDMPATTASEPDVTMEAVPSETEPPKPGTYVPDSMAEQQTDGALCVFDPGISEMTGLIPWGSDMLVLSGYQTTTLTLLEGDSLAVAARERLDCKITAENGTVQVTDQGTAYYCSTQRSVVFLDRTLKEIRKVNLPEQTQGVAVVSPDWSAVYYCTSEGVHAIDLRTGITRLLKEQLADHQHITGIYFDGAVLSCYSEREKGAGKIAYLSAQTGETLHDNKALDRLSTDADRYFAQMCDGSMDVCLLGVGREEPRMLYVPENTAVLPVVARGGVVLNSGGGELSLVSQDSGTCISKIQADVLENILYCTADADAIWFAVLDESQSKDVICRWEPVEGAADDEAAYLTDYFTATSPDREGLARCAAQAEAIGEAYGVTILIWEDALPYQPWDYTFEPEYRVAVYQRDLAVLEAALAKFPEGFFREAASGSDSGSLTICLVRGLNSGNRAVNPESAYGAQYWIEDSAYIALAMGSGLERTFYHEVSHVIDNRVISTSKAYDDWESLNPWAFDYDYDYAANKNRDPEDYLEDENRLFIDTYSMSYPKEDRARILEYAMMPGNESYFQSDWMQQKLYTICMAMRDVFDLDENESYPWEQYLAE